MVEALPTHIDGTEPLRFPTSRTLVTTAQRIAKVAFGAAPFITLRLRKGERHMQYPSKCGDPASVLRAVMRVQRRKHPQPQHIFVATNMPGSFLRSVVVGLRPRFRSVVTEGDLPGLKRKSRFSANNFLVFLSTQASRPETGRVAAPHICCRYG